MEVVGGIVVGGVLVVVDPPPEFPGPPGGHGGGGLHPLSSWAVARLSLESSPLVVWEVVVVEARVDEVVVETSVDEVVVEPPPVPPDGLPGHFGHPWSWLTAKDLP